MAWRVSGYDRLKEISYGEWASHLNIAYNLILLAQDIRRSRIHEVQKAERYIHTRNEIDPLLTEDQRLELWLAGRIVFEEGCKIITSLRKKRAAISRFRAACAEEFLKISGEDIARYEAVGFNGDELTDLRLQFSQIDASAFRRPYTRSGKYSKDTD